MRLEVGSVHVGDVRFGTHTGLDGSTFTLDRTELTSLLAGDPAFAGMEVELARPGDSCRVINILDIVEPRYRLDGMNYPGALSPIVIVGDGHTRAIGNLLVVGCDLSGGH